MVAYRDDFLRRRYYHRDWSEAREQATQSKQREWQCKGPVVGVSLMWSKTSKKNSED